MSTRLPPLPLLSATPGAMLQTSQLPESPFTVRDLSRLGLTRRTLRQWVDRGLVRRVVRGAYVPASLRDTPGSRARAIALVVAPGQVVTDRTAAYIHGIDTLTYAEHDVPPPVDVCALRGQEPTSRRGTWGRTRDLAGQDIMRIGTVDVTTPLRTALDLGCLLRRREAMAALDAFCRVHGLTRADLERGAARYRRRRGVVQLRELVGLVDPRAESARESWTRLELHDAGLPTPEPQLWIEVDGVARYRLDLAYEFSRVAVEYDGFDSHERTPEQLAHDEERRRWLREHGWTVIVIRVGDFSGERLDRWLGEVRSALVPDYSAVRAMERNARLGRA